MKNLQKRLSWKDTLKIVSAMTWGIFQFQSAFAQNEDMLTIPKSDTKYETIKKLGERVINECNFKGKAISYDEFMNEKVLYEIYHKDFNDTLSIGVDDVNNNCVFDEGDILNRDTELMSSSYNTPYTLTHEGVGIGYSYVNAKVFSMLSEVSQESIEEGVSKEYMEEWLKEKKEWLKEGMYKKACEEIESYEQFLR